MAIGLAAGVAWFAVVFVVHMIVLWTTPPSARPRWGQMVFLSGLVGLLASLWPLETLFGASITSSALVFSAMAGVLTYGALLALYLPFYYTVVASHSLRTIVLLSEQGTNAMSIADLRRRFASPALVAQRFTTMASNRFLVEHNNGYSLTAKGRRVARIFLLVKELWRLGAGG